MHLRLLSSSDSFPGEILFHLAEEILVVVSERCIGLSTHCAKKFSPAVNRIRIGFFICIGITDCFFDSPDDGISIINKHLVIPRLVTDLRVRFVADEGDIVHLGDSEYDVADLTDCLKCLGIISFLSAVDSEPEVELRT